MSCKACRETTNGNCGQHNYPAIGDALQTTYLQGALVACEDENAALKAEIDRLKGDLSGLRRENAALKARAEKAEALAERRRIEREQALNVTTREGLSASEWLMRTAQAEARAEKAEADLTKLRGHESRLTDELRADLARAVEERDAALKHLRAALDAFAGGTFKEQQDVFIKIERFLGVGRG